MHDELINFAIDNQEYFRKVKSGLKFCQSFKLLIERVNKIRFLVEEIQSFAGDYDLDEESPGNGYRSYVFIANKAISKTIQICKNLKENREKIFFKKSFYEKEVAAYSELLSSLLVMGNSLVENHKRSDDTCLYSEVGIYENTVRKTAESLNLESFYGRVFGFQLSKCSYLPLKYSSVVISTFSEYFYSNENKFFKFIRIPSSFLKFWFNDKAQARQMVDVFENTEVNFGFNLTNLAETKIFGIFQELAEHKVSVNEVIVIPPEPLELYSEKHGKLIEIPIPSSHIDEKPISSRLFSARRRQGMTNSKAKNAEKSKYLIIHCHGGGWFTQSSKFHGSYLKEWALELDVPILSIDYSLAPKAAFPRAVEEVFYAYCWALKNPELFGSTGENIVLVGDSAGGNLVTACVIKCIEMGIPKPKGLFNIYAVFMANHVTAPSRYLSLMDVVLTHSMYTRLFPAYNGYEKKALVIENRKIPKLSRNGNNELPKHHLFSPHFATDEVLREFPPTIVLSTTLDACLDEGVEFAKRLRKVNVEVKLDVLEGLNHGFLNVSQVSEICHQGSETCMKHLAKLLGMN